jgi:hypothetical protein
MNFEFAIWTRTIKKNAFITYVYDALKRVYGFDIWKRGVYVQTNKQKNMLSQLMGEFLDISSLGVSYRYVVKIEQKFKQQNKREFGSANLQQPKYGKGIPNSQNINLKTTSPSHKKRRVMGRRRRTLGSGVTSTKSLGTTPMNVAQNNHW